jgi:hypothetical protein
MTNTIVAAAVALAALTTSATAADFYVTPSTTDKPATVLIIGEIVLTDAVKFQAATAGIKGKALVGLSSPGGNILGGIGIAETIRTNGWSTAVLHDYTCASICSIIWLAGTTRIADSFAHIGMHSASIEVRGKMRRSEFGNTLLTVYLNKLGLSYQAAAAMLATAPDQLMWLTPEKAKTLGITYTQI